MFFQSGSKTAVRVIPQISLPVHSSVALEPNHAFLIAFSTFPQSLLLGAVHIIIIIIRVHEFCKYPGATPKILGARRVIYSKVHTECPQYGVTCELGCLSGAFCPVHVTSCAFFWCK
jgi:hypothetical protein